MPGRQQCARLPVGFKTLCSVFGKAPLKLIYRSSTNAVGTEYYHVRSVASSIRWIMRRMLASDASTSPT